MRLIILLSLLALTSNSHALLDAQEGGGGAGATPYVGCACLKTETGGGGKAKDNRYGLLELSQDECLKRGGQDLIYRREEVDEKAKILSKPEPELTDTVRARRITGVIRLRVILCPSGTVDQIKVIKGLDEEVDELAMAAAKRIRFKPAVKRGQRVAQRQMLEYNIYP